MTPTEALSQLSTIAEVLAGLPENANVIDAHLGSVAGEYPPAIHLYAAGGLDVLRHGKVKRLTAEWKISAEVKGVDVFTLVRTDGLPRWAAEQLKAEREAEFDAAIAALGAK